MTAPNVVLVDPLSSGIALLAKLQKAGANIICVHSTQLFKNPSLHTADFRAVFHLNTDIPEKEAYRALLQDLQSFLKEMDIAITACMVGCETGVELAEFLANGLGVPTNDPAFSEQRRCKYLMGERVREAGIRAVQQISATKWEQVEAFVKELNPIPFKVVAKPQYSAGSDGVTLANSMEELKAGFDAVYMKKNALGILETEVLIQEFLVGKEYVVDTVSRNGVHKVCATWVYDKRPANGRSFVYHGMRLVNAQSKVGQELSCYVLKVLDAVGIAGSAGHAEVIMTKTGPCLVEIGARPAGGYAAWEKITEPAIGYTTIDAMVMAALEPDKFEALPTVPSAPVGAGTVFCFVARKAGKLQGFRKNGMESLDSYKDFGQNCKFGAHMPLTLNLFSVPCIAILYNKNQAQLEADIDSLRKMELTDFFVLEQDTVMAEKRVINDTKTHAPTPKSSSRMCRRSSSSAAA